MDTVRIKHVLRSTKIGSVTPDNMVVRLGPEYGNVLPSECFFRISDPSNCLILVICVVMVMEQAMK